MRRRRPDIGEARSLRVVAMRADLESRRDEASEVWQYLEALDAAAGERLSIFGTDCRSVARVRFVGERGEVADGVPIWRALRERTDVVIVFGAVPVRHLPAALLFRIRGARIVFVPLALLTRDFGRRSWYRRRGALFAVVKPVAIRVLTWVWSLISTVICCASAEEVRQAGFAHRKTVLLPWPWPDTGIGRLVEDPAAATSRDRGGPLAVVARYDPWRKGFDRIAAWLEHVQAEGRPARPLALLLAPRPEVEDDVAARLGHLADAGMLEWDPLSTGSTLVERLSSCRGLVQLSRWDGQARSVREALLLGLPLVVTPSCNVEELVEVLDAGVVVDGDDPRAVHEAFEAAAKIDVDVSAARAAFAPSAIGAYLLDVTLAAAHGRIPVTRSYYDTISALGWS